ncbi:MAG: EscU/YscU/HrcU family type III secretion system export apparatus switch protein [Desulfobacteraceae bacterium]|jgi:flagellar biosynthesis protein
MIEKKTKKAAALRYEHGKESAPRVVAKGRGKIAEKIVALANTHQVPLVEDQNLVQLLEALDVDTQIPAELYQAVAEVLVFVYQLNHESRKQA